MKGCLVFLTLAICGAFSAEVVDTVAPVQTDKPITAEKATSDVAPVQTDKPITAEKTTSNVAPVQTDKPITAEKTTSAVAPVQTVKPLTAENITNIVNTSSKKISDEITFDDVVAEEVTYSVWFFTTTGTIDLRDGHMKKMSNYSVRGRVKEINPARFDVPIRFRTLDFRYNYESRVPYITNKGILKVELENIDVTLPISIAKDNSFQLDHMPKAKINDIHLSFSGKSGLKDLLFDLMSDSYHKMVKHLFNDIYLLQILHAIVDEMNKNNTK